MYLELTENMIVPERNIVSIEFFTGSNEFRFHFTKSTVAITATDETVHYVSHITVKHDDVPYKTRRRIRNLK